MKPLYLDNAATTHMSEEVITEMKNSLGNFGNTEAKYYCYAEEAKKDVLLARNRIATGLGCDADEVIFTSGATEANNLFIQGVAKEFPSKRKIIISSIEHSSVLEVANYMKSIGYEVIEVPVNRDGLVDLKILENSIDNEVLFVSIIFVNNEIGTIQDINSIDKICQKKKVILHIDATQAVGKVPINLSRYKALKYMTLSSHKIYGPKGIGALIARKDNGLKAKIKPLFYGGEQENGFRPGTLSNLLIVGFGKAVELATSNIDKDNERLKMLERTLIEKLKAKFGNLLKINNDNNTRVPGILNIQIVGQNNMVILKQMSPYIAASNGSACSVAKPSHVLKAIGLSDDEISWSIRLALSKDNDISELDIIDEL